MTKENQKSANPIKTAGLEELNKIREEVKKEKDELERKEAELRYQKMLEDRR